MAFFSVVIPTHQRLHLLQEAIQTIVRQDFRDWELIVFDNGSTEPVREHVASLNDDRVRYQRSDEFLPVTQSWNRAIDYANGDYVILLGDDDGLAPHYFSEVAAVTARFNQPDIVYCALYQFLHPGVAPWEPSGYVSDVKNGFFFTQRSEPFLLSRDEARKAVLGSLHLRRNFTFNMQAFAFSKTFLSKLRQDGPVFTSPFPDYYLANTAFARSESTVIIPQPLTIAGVSKASFGFTLFNSLESAGEAVLNARIVDDPLYPEIAAKLLPGPAYNTNYAITMEHVARATRDEFGAKVAWGRYRRLQIFSALLSQGDLSPQMANALTPLERLWAIVMRGLLGLTKRSAFLRGRLQPILDRSVSPYAFRPIERMCRKGGFSGATEVYEALELGVIA